MFYSILSLIIILIIADLVHEIANLYIQTNADMKRTILRQIETPIKKIGSGSQELLSLIISCPSGSETLIVRIIYILTEKCKIFNIEFM